MSDRSIEEYYDRMDEIKRKHQNERYNQIVSEFEHLSLEEKVDKLIKVYATKMAYRE